MSSRVDDRAPDPLSGWRFAALCGAILAAINVPYAYRFATTPSGSTPYYCDFMNFGDLLTYVTWMKQAAQGHLLFINLYDPAPQPRVLFLPLFLLLGRLARSLHVELLLMWQLARVALGAILLLTIRWFCRREAPAGAARTRSFLLLALGMGVPRIPEAMPVFSLFDNALLVLAWILMLVAGGNWLAACRSESLALGRTVATGACGAAMLLTHHYDAVTLAAMLIATSALAIIRTRRLVVLARLAVASLMMAPFGLLSLWSVRQNPSLAAFAMVPRVRWGWELPAFGTILILAVAFVFVARRATPGPDWLHVAWVLSSLALLYSPLPSPRRYIQGMGAPLCMLAARGFDELISRGWRRLPKYCLVAAFPAAAVMLGVDMMEIIPKLPRHIARSVLQDVATLEELPPGLVMAPPGLDYLIPPFAGRQVYAGNYGQTPRYLERVATFDDFRAGRIDGAALSKLGVRYVLVPSDMASSWPGLRMVAPMRRTVLYEVAP